MPNMALNPTGHMRGPNLWLFVYWSSMGFRSGIVFCVMCPAG